MQIGCHPGLTPLVREHRDHETRAFATVFRGCLGAVQADSLPGVGFRRPILPEKW